MTDLGLDDELLALNRFLSSDVNPATKSIDLGKKLLKSTDNPFDQGALQSVASSSDVENASGDGVVSLRDKNKLSSLSFDLLGTGDVRRYLSNGTLVTEGPDISVPAGRDFFQIKINSISDLYTRNNYGGRQRLPHPSSFDTRPQFASFYNVRSGSLTPCVFFVCMSDQRPAAGRSVRNSTFNLKYLRFWIVSQFSNRSESINLNRAVAFQIGILPTTSSFRVDMYRINFSLYSIKT